jgi:spermidine dehydrogenase
MLPLEALAGQDAASEPWKQEPFLAQGITQDDPRYYPPALTGFRGSHPDLFEVAHQLRDGNHWDDLGAEAETGEKYDLVIVGGGISGLAAAYFFRKAAGPKAKILILDNHDDFGGHAKRNEFQSGKHFLIGYGGAQKLRLIFARQQTFQTFRKVDKM